LARDEFARVFAFSQFLPRLEALIKTIGRELVMTEAVTRHLSQDVEHPGEGPVRDNHRYRQAYSIISSAREGAGSNRSAK
jgi:ketosteroid isomerase-like protein